MPSQQEIQINEYTLNLLSVKMKVKFPCKMKLQHSGNTITEEVEASEPSKFVFNQEVTIQESSNQPTVDFSIILVTEKGSKYVSGLVKLAMTDIEKAEGQKIITPLTKCLDSEAYCELKILKIGKTPKRISVSSTLIEMKKVTNESSIKSPNQQTEFLSPKNRKVNGVETRSEIGLGGLGLRNGQHEWEETRSKGAAQTLIYRSSFLKSPKEKKTGLMQSPKSRVDFNHEYELVSQRQKLSTGESEVYKQGYQKLKQKYKSQAQTLNCEHSKRQQLQANQNNYRVQIMRLKLKTQQQERIICQKNEKINQLQVVVSEINKQDLDVSYLRQENATLEEKILVMTDLVAGLKKDNANVKKLYEDAQRNDGVLMAELRAELQNTKHKLQAYSQEISQTIRLKTQQIASLTNQLKTKSTQLQIQRQEIYKLQAHNQSKIYQFEKTLQEQKNASSQTANQLRQKIELLQREKKQVQKQIGEVKNDKQKIKALILKAEYDKKVLSEEQKTMKGELKELKGVREKYHELTGEFALLSEDNKHLRKQLQLQAESKQVNLQEITEQHEVTVNYYKKQAKDFQEKHKTIAIHKIQLQTQLQAGNNTIERQKRQLESSANQILSVKNVVKQLKEYTSELQQQRLNLQNELAVTNNKVKFSEHTSKMELDKFKTEIERTKLQLQSQNMKAVALYEQKSNLQIELNKNKIQLQYHQDKIDKLFSSNKDYQATIQSLHKDHQTQINDCQHQLDTLKQTLKINHQTLYALEIKQFAHLQTLQTNKKDIKLYDEKITHLQALLKSRIEAIHSWEDKYKLLEKTLAAIENEHSLLKHDHSLLKSDHFKTQKISQLKTQQIQNLKNDLLQTHALTHQLEHTELTLRQQLKKLTEKHVKLQLKLKSLDREHNKFKQLMNRTIKSQFSKLPLIHSVLSHNQKLQDQTQRKAKSQADKGNANNNNDSKVTVILNGSGRQIQVTPQQVTLQTLSVSGILSQLTSSITDSKTTLYRLIEHNKQLKKQIQSLKEQSEQSSHKYQFTEIELHRQLQDLEDELNNVYGQKQEEIVNYDKTVSELNGKLHDKENLCQELNQQVEELEYALSALKLDFENNNNQNDKKVALLKQLMAQLEEKTDFFKLSLANQQDANHDLDEKYQILKNDYQQQAQNLAKAKFLIEQLTKGKQHIESSLQSTLKQRKSLLEELQSVELQLGVEKSMRVKANALLEQEEKKSVELKEFVGTLMKQKESIIRSQLQKSDKILQLQTQQIELRRDLELGTEEGQRMKSQLQEVKERLRKQSTLSKSLQVQLGQTRSKLRKASQRVEQKQKQMQLREQTISRLEKNYRQLTEKNYKQTVELHSQIDSKYSQNINITKQLTQKILLLEARIQELEHLTAKQNHDNLHLHEETVAQKERILLMLREQHKLTQQIEELTLEAASLNRTNQHLTLQIQTREEHLSQFNQRIILLQSQLQTLAKDNTLQLEELNLDWTRKHHSQHEQHLHTLSLVQNERQMLRAQLQQTINQLDLSNSHQLNSQLGINTIKLNYHSKIKTLQTDRLQAIQTKNLQIQTLQNQNQSLLSNIVELEASLKQNSQLVENLTKRLLNQQKIRKDHEEKHQSHTKLQQAQIASLLSQQTAFKSQKQQLYQTLWTNQRQVRKVVQNYVKKVLDQCDNLHIDKVTKSSNGLQAQVVKAMTFKLSTAEV